MTKLQVAQQPSPNCGPRRDGLRPKLIVLHYTAMASAEAALERLCDPEAEVSAHYLVGTKGQITQLVPEELRAWHAGPGEWHGQEDINSRSIGIELDNRGNHPFPEPQMKALETLMRGIMARWDIGPESVVGHSDTAIGRKIDPGPRFDWTRLARAGLAAPSGAGSIPTTVTAKSFRAHAQASGYTEPANAKALLHAVRLRHRPWATGPLCAQDYAALPNGSKNPARGLKSN